MPNIEQLAVSAEKAARLAGVGRTLIYGAIKNGALASLKVGKRRLIRVAALDKWLLSLERATD
jgi:excisionase family DNA binding protein